MSQTIGDLAAKMFSQWCRNHGMPAPTPEHRFHDVRRFRFDYAWIPQKVALEVEGGVWTKGRHTRGKGFLKDMEKYNLAVSMGWRVFRCTPTTLHTLDTIELVKAALNASEAA